MDVGLADRLRAFGLVVIEVDGWTTRGRTYNTFAPRGSVNHHTAGALSGGNAPSLGICINGRSDLPGPLCNVFMARNLDVYVVAAGIANHAGPGGWRGLAQNWTVHGLEIENDGFADEPATDPLMDHAARVHAAFLQAPGSSGDAALTCEHFEWSTQGKIDFHDWPGADLRSRVASYLAHPAPLPPVLPTTEDDVFDNRVFYAKRTGSPHVCLVGINNAVLTRHVTSFKVAELVCVYHGWPLVAPPSLYATTTVTDSNGDKRVVAEVGDGDLLLLP